ncbi:uncharacterized protein B0P05DRAFT_515295 [Gilbertella persicaria]|uniref:Meiotic expression up-regulated protein 10 n=1 Tax=Rhizopus stolonifer TaxID=4846 RepID=A0A367KRA9_RHIST|nr:uncharacterized protein B0P05DRAFT_515295 [Gilbertella persicaria]KAI8065388.1 hypothetical protein B0P05DRAFT_515295 [Gilbertella persicaria]RCI04745.1 hypothetical protein CU098_008978 [Rhizopus stolonifer]
MKLPVYARFGFVFAAALLATHVEAGCSGELKVVTQHDLDQVRSCKTYSGNIVIDNVGVADLKVNGIELVEGDILVKNNDGLMSFSMPKLQGVNGHIVFSNNKILSAIDIKQVYALRGIEVAVHPALNELVFATGLSQAEKISITDTTITKFDGIKLNSVKDIEISNNIYLKNLSFGNMTKIGNILVSANSPSMQVDLDQVESLHDATFRNVAGISLKNLKKVGGDISFISNSFESLTLPIASDIGGTLTLTENMLLNNLSMPHLNHLGGALSVNNNNKLNSISAFASLQQVDGTLDITGGFDELDFPVLVDVRGGLNIQTSSDQFSCDNVNKLKHGIIKGNAFICKSAVAQPQSNLHGGKGGGKGGNGNFESAANTLTYHAGYLTLLGATLACMI